MYKPVYSIYIFYSLVFPRKKESDKDKEKATMKKVVIHRQTENHIIITSEICHCSIHLS